MTLEEIKALNLSQIKERKAEIRDLMDSDDADIDALTEEVDNLEARSKEIKLEVEKRNSLKSKLASVERGKAAMKQPTIEKQSLTGVEARKSMEYRKAFMEYVQKGTHADVLQTSQRAAIGVAQDLGVLLPETIVQTVIEELKGKYGQLYNKVSKWNFQGGVKVPVGSFGATFKRITETTV